MPHSMVSVGTGVHVEMTETRRKNGREDLASRADTTSLYPSVQIREGSLCAMFMEIAFGADLSKRQQSAAALPVCPLAVALLPAIC